MFTLCTACIAFPVVQHTVGVSRCGCCGGPPYCGVGCGVVSRSTRSIQNDHHRCNTELQSLQLIACVPAQKKVKFSRWPLQRNFANPYQYKEEFPKIRKLLPFSDIVFKYLEQPSYYSRKEGQSGERIAITGVWNCDALRLLHILRLFKDKGSAMAVWGVVRGDPASVHSCPLTPTLQLATKCQLGRTCHSV
ncbi:hypothetical protein J6590_040709 [Homalodisca vitripennis]|nr:hypothetical protein J6590_040709 [Homalodisca vitripennis]